MKSETVHRSGNFGFLAEHDSLFVELAEAAERAFSSDPNTTLIKLRQLGEAMAQHLAALCVIEFDEQTSQSDLLYDAFKDLYNGQYNEAAVAKITGQSDKVDQLIRRYKNERYPNIAITVDLLTTGIDVPHICKM
ncbi:MAG: hypothetical protein ACTHYN_11145 [Marinobacter sp.]|uniref:hypothetical protein n=1 Tax=Marinobacter sp. TaxID=50741 RepID=UPI003F9AB346